MKGALCERYNRILDMPTILVILGWRLFFYANEGNEPIHVHCRKGEMGCKYWLNRENFDLDEALNIICHQRIKDKFEKSFMNILNALNNNGTSFNGGVTNEKAS